ncbi:hypothetical protein [Streptomyces fulvoviolaceus]|uniref:hypothetical protein n=1 Tax=Streptomyces fulvoviolaceus TaxID=285535 RepID=UPI001F48626B|nr:hypothetical protein [Streptomyces fulvoviolaceus]
MAKDVSSSVREPNSIAPSASTLTSRRWSGSVPMVRYFMVVLPFAPSSGAHERESSS